MRRLIINADDFGLTDGINRGIVEAHAHGLLTSATMMANGEAFASAAHLARSVPQLGVGCHIVLVDGQPVLNPPGATLLAKSDGAKTQFPTAISAFAFRVLRGQVEASQIEAEAVAQLSRLQSAGIAVTHVDSHKHTHLFPQVLRPLLRAARRCGVRAVRNPFEAPHSLLKRNPRLWIRHAEVSALRAFAPSFYRIVHEEDMISPDGSVGITITGMLDEGLFRQTMRALPEGTWELVCHPGYNDGELQNIRTRLRDSRAEELAILTSSAAREVVTRADIELISYRELVAG